MQDEDYISKIIELVADVWLQHRDEISLNYNACEEDECAWCEDARKSCAAITYLINPDVLNGDAQTMLNFKPNA